VPAAAPPPSLALIATRVEARLRAVLDDEIARWSAFDEDLRDPMQQIATPGNYFYQPQPTQLVGVFDAITADLAKGTSRING